MAGVKFLDSEGLKLVVADYKGRDDKKVDKEAGKQLIETTKVEKLDGLANIKKVQLNSVDVTIGEDGVLNLDVEGVITGDNLINDTELQAALADYLKTENIDTALATYTTDEELATALADYLKTENIDTALESYAKDDEVDTKLQGYVKNDEFDAKVQGVVGSVYRPKGSLDNFEAIKAVVSPAEGDVYNATDTGANYVYVGGSDGVDGTGWDKLSETVDLSGYATTASMTEELGKKANQTDFEALQSTVESKPDAADMPEALSPEEIQSVLSGEAFVATIKVASFDASLTGGTVKCHLDTDTEGTNDQTTDVNETGVSFTVKSKGNYTITATPTDGEAWTGTVDVQEMKAYTVTLTQAGA